MALLRGNFPIIVAQIVQANFLEGLLECSEMCIIPGTSYAFLRSLQRFICNHRSSIKRRCMTLLSS